MSSFDWMAAIALAERAPSIHNTQPWRFVVEGDAIELWADRSRGLATLDPYGRQLTVSCGAALEQLCLAVIAQSQRPAVVLLPDPDSPDLLAQVQVVGPGTPTAVEADLIAEIPRRSTVRAPFESRPVPDEIVDAISRESAVEDTWVHPILRREDVVTLSVLLTHAEAAEKTDPAYLQELEHWRRAEPASDGIPDAALPVLTERHSDVSLRDFPPPAAADRPGEADQVPPDEKPLLVIVGTPTDTQLDWLNAGRRLARLLLRAASFGIVASPLGQVIDDDAPRQQVRHQLGLLGWPQMLLRMGYGHAEPVTGRRAVDEVVHVSNQGALT
jgi:nitroreductase